MHHKITKDLYDAFPPDRKGDFWAGYLYLKYTEHFLNKTLEISGAPHKELPPLDPAIEDMLSAVAWQVAENAASAETSLYHGKVMRPQDVRKLVTQKEDLHISPPERVVPFKIARDIILENPSSIVVGACPCRSQSPSPCLPPGEQDVCMFIGDPWAAFMDEQNASYHRISQDEAVKILDACHQKGFVHTAYFEHAAGNRLDAICNCCGCCCQGVKMWNLLGGAVPLLAPSGYVAEVNEECNGCGLCADGTCKFAAISLGENGGSVVINRDKCMGCGVCEDVCPLEALHLRREPSKGDPLDLDELKAQL
jgi:ferredoxin